MGSSSTPLLLPPKKVTLLVDDNNFLTWKHVFLIIKTHQLCQFIDGLVTVSLQVIVGDDGFSVENPAYAQYEQQNSALSAWLLSTLSASLHNKLIGSSSFAYELWEALTRIFGTQSTTKAMRYYSAYDDDAANPIFGTRHSIGPSTHLSRGPFTLAYMCYPDHGPSESHRSKPYSDYFDPFVSGSSMGSLPPIGASNIVQEDVASVSSTLSILFDPTCIIPFAKASTSSSAPVPDSSSSVTTLSVVMIPSIMNMPSTSPMSCASDSITLSPQSSATSTHFDIPHL
ncbi:hypothetical protein J1N35_044160 [Gossypium stocksii]|uniref:Retrotransposon Copia-like N-terminal domain-containing protein n=1 Tax=Gossypium stocksii TaxID=47602 RepID=A0A9D3ZFQ6_9ROSI|nr:hypothetical protein J1N35_044160 [Gossypium stocksii]